LGKSGVSDRGKGVNGRHFEGKVQNAFFVWENKNPYQIKGVWQRNDSKYSTRVELTYQTNIISRILQQ
jgi:hypothetical protein